VVGAVIDLAHAHDLIVIGEGVETHEQLDALRRMGCDRAQGYLMGRPMPPTSWTPCSAPTRAGSRQRV
jgi:EAL domain-containing protein (putative c-di-GMP-specific phosphodiesterase class I)